jgi:hypothetical protein
MISNAFFKASYSSRLPWPLLAHQLEPTPLIKPIHQVWVATIANLPTALEAPAFAERVPKAAFFSQSGFFIHKDDNAITAIPIDDGTRSLASNAPAVYVAASTLA